MRASWPILLRTGMLRPVYHGEHGLRTLRELGRSYQTTGKDLKRVMNRVKALYRGWSIPCAGTQVYAPRHREEWLNKIPHTGVRRRAELLYQQLDGGLVRSLLGRRLIPRHKPSGLTRDIAIDICAEDNQAARIVSVGGRCKSISSAPVACRMR
jgi:hypothetical protein